MSPNWQSSRDLAVVMLSSLVLASTLTWSATAIVVLCLRRTSAAMKHRLWGMSMLAVVFSPVLTGLLPIPRWTWPVSQAEQVTVVPFQTQQPETTIRDTASGFMQTNTPDLQPENSVDGITIVTYQTSAAGVDLPTNRRWSLDGLLTVAAEVWMIGMVVGVMGMVLSLRKTWVWLRQTMPIESGRERDLCESLRHEIGITRTVWIALSSEITVPFIAGLVRPVIVLPSGVGKWSLDRLNIVLSHELMHARRGDVWWQLMAQVCLIPVWFHPLGWYALWRLRMEGEHACDDAVLLSGQSPCDYASHLVELAAELRKHSLALPLHTVAMARNAPIERRVRSILDPTTAREPISRFRAISVTVAMLIAIMLIAPLTPGYSQLCAKSTDRDDDGKAANTKADSDAAAIPTAESIAERLDVVAEQQEATEAVEREGSERPAKDPQLKARPEVAKPARELRETPESRVLRRVLPSVGNIHTEKKPTPGGYRASGQVDKLIQGMGTGIVIDERGYLVTSLHVVDSVDSIRVDFVDQNQQKASYSARAVQVDREHDLAIIKLDSSNKFPVLPLGVSADLARGERVIAIGNSFGFTNTATFGFIAGLDRDLQLNEKLTYKNLIQTDVAINPGNSGGPLVNLDGEVIGINVAVRANSQKFGFAIPIDDARNWIESMMAAEKETNADEHSKNAK